METTGGTNREITPNSNEPDQAIVGTWADWAMMVDDILSPSNLMAEPGGPMKTIFCLEADRASGSFGFSDACPLKQNKRINDLGSI
jgi:hypothetical protein